jgi:hypothetical protein
MKLKFIPQVSRMQGCYAYTYDGNFWGCLGSHVNCSHGNASHDEEVLKVPRRPVIPENRKRDNNIAKWGGWVGFLSRVTSGQLESLRDWIRKEFAGAFSVYIPSLLSMRE